MESGIRIAKFLAGRNVCSRREAERHITQGDVTVNGVVITSPVTFVSECDTILFCGRRVGQIQGAKASQTRLPRLWLYHKPTGEITTHHDPQGRPTVFESARSLGLPRVVSIGRLDLNSEGLLLLTDSAALASALEKPSQAMERLYRVRLFGSPSSRFFRQAQELAPLRFRLPSLTLEGIHYAPFTIAFERSFERPEPHNFWATITLTEGKNREIRKLMKAFRWQVNRLIRLRYGPFELGDLKPGQVRLVSSSLLRGLLGTFSAGLF